MRHHTIHFATVTALAGTLVLALAGCVDGGGASAGVTPPPTVLPVPSMGEPGTSTLGELGPDDGYVAVGDRLTLDDAVPAVQRLDPVLRDALAAAAADAASRGIHFTFTDAWRSEAYQEHLFDQAVQEYGSESEARRWVKPAGESHHVTGMAVDVATADAMDWLNRFGADYGLCQIYANELWHFEYVDGVDGDGQCPEQLADSSIG
jgi:zinc D-Ala-D-Ala carboxypeptidase